ncbi:MAG TPA: hypothetical protein VM682_08080 [Bacillus sp. (in: firmicutes)]|nr:hypothetical protein [Bacillus sp. (in: firmicutes)]
MKALEPATLEAESQPGFQRPVSSSVFPGATILSILSNISARNFETMYEFSKINYTKDSSASRVNVLISSMRPSCTLFAQAGSASKPWPIPTKSNSSCSSRSSNEKYRHQHQLKVPIT